MPLYLDSCAVIKRYVDENDGGTTVMDQIMENPAWWGGLASSEWLRVEVVATLSKMLRSGTLKQRQFIRRYQDFTTELAAVVNLIPIEPGDTTAASALIRSDPDVRLESGDALHLHTAEQLGQRLGGQEKLVFVTSDRRLANLLSRRGIDFFDPVHHSVAGLRDGFRG